MLNRAKGIFMEKEKNTLPISLKSIQIENYAGIKKTAIEDLPGDAQWIFLTGENGFGKTSVLRGIGLALFNHELVLLEKKIVIKANVLYSSGETVEMSAISKPDLFSLEGFAAYGTSRLEIAHDTSSNEAAVKSGRLYSLFRSDGVLLSVEAEMKIWEQRHPTYFSNLKNTLIKVLDKRIGNIFIDEEDSAKVKYVELDKNGSELPPVTFEKLASGYRSIVAMVGDLLIRFYKIYSKETKPEEFAGIVIIDELDAHLHPKLQKKIPGILSGVFPNMQFIASIHSPIPILGAPENAVFLKVNRDKESGVTVDHLDQIQVRSLTPNTLFSSPIFDFDEIIGDHHDRETERLVTEDHYDEAVFNQVLEKKLKQMARDANIDPDTILKK